MFLFTPKHDLISSHSTLPVLLTLSRTLSPSHLSSLLSPSLLFSLLFKNTAWNFPNRKQQYMWPVTWWRSSGHRGHRSGKIPADTETHTHTNFNTCIVNRTRGTFHRQHATVCPHLRSRFISYTVFLYITTCLSKADSHKNDTTI